MSDVAGTNAADLEEWVRDDLSLPAGASVAIAEKPGSDPRCSPVVTEVAVATPDGDSYSFHIERPLAELERMDLIAALAFGGGH
ncbi:hypothetical protein BH23ACT1_BH23ACT1_11950 [soil metagenome]|jgi:hypothetical protein|nr:hypothetical protein [Acidimicrobiia bacterium]